MSRIGKKCIKNVDDVDIVIDDHVVIFSGPKGRLSFKLINNVNVSFSDGILSVVPVDSSRKSRAAWGMSRTMLNNCLLNVKKGHEIKLELSGVGYRCSMSEGNLNLKLGYSHDIIYSPPEGITISVPKPTEIIVFGIDKQQVGDVAAKIRDYRVIEPYKGRGIKYSDEVIVRKEGKKK
ncbi:50S ribosomal protein L6 [Candidatus Liberibacter americanus]|uniref:50S ribosomal protein L6 n=1 Tax=Candidatus Liberibacter americanus str. Sao Paulo TaxID=1261131 RepID=U6B5I8_9HYPH|nr:50S ribosomal protein L6 [Candidatus Liberibacter americanus]AHA28260.1 Ribosomal protein L6 [Candidatus Liberibacter americanus str. Sao Paulo]EMS36226.1 50S ribosomal protein L6 [Candidatus Liberibacter americanus PW_SP]